MSQSDLYDFFSYVARDGKSNADSPASAMKRRASVTSSSSFSSSDESSSSPTPASTTTRATATPAPPPVMMPISSRILPSPSSSSSSPTVAAKQQPHRLTADEITARILESPSTTPCARCSRAATTTTTTTPAAPRTSTAPSWTWQPASRPRRCRRLLFVLLVLPPPGLLVLPALA
ncbi:uncharacterized protein PG998_013722 [Apiospora kogelbergensis]|uniref:uncharacterized protein n=1 Tax=Apiospora kogelbergensis TaxID=1337665 RepID=UPI0031328B1A